MTSATITSPAWRMAPLMAAVAYAFAVFSIWGAGHGAQIAVLWLDYAAAIAAAGIFAGSVALICGVCARRPRSQPCALLAQTFVAERWRADRCLSLWQPPLTFIILTTTFSFFKQVVLPRAGFGYDPVIAAADRALFGTDPWRITHSVFASPWWSELIDLAYHAWFAPMMLGVVFCAFARSGSLLAWRYMLAYCLMWIVQGSMLAYAFPAAGPVFVETMSHVTRFTPLTDLLSAQNAFLRAHGAPGLNALLFQHYLLHIFQGHAVAEGGGISAMPSLHNAMAILFACGAWHVSPRWGRAMTAYAGLIWTGSIHLGWHYALDGIVALVATVAVWKLTGVLGTVAQRRSSRQPRAAPPLAPALPLAPDLAAAQPTL